MNEKVYPRIGERVLEKTLPNGLKIFIVPKPQHRKKYAFFATRYGGMDMQFIRNGKKCDTPAGIAHYLEHKMFDTEDGNALQQLSQNGAEPNAFTSNAMTGYYFDCTEHFEENLRISACTALLPRAFPSPARSRASRASRRRRCTTATVRSIARPTWRCASSAMLIRRR